MRTMLLAPKRGKSVNRSRTTQLFQLFQDVPYGHRTARYEGLLPGIMLLASTYACGRSTLNNGTTGPFRKKKKKKKKRKKREDREKQPTW